MAKTPKSHSALVKKLKKDPKVKDPEALAAWIGRRIRRPKKRRRALKESSLFDRIVGEAPAE